MTMSYNDTTAMPFTKDTSLAGDTDPGRAMQLATQATAGRSISVATQSSARQAPDQSPRQLAGQLSDPSAVNPFGPAMLVKKLVPGIPLEDASILEPEKLEVTPSVHDISFAEVPITTAPQMPRQRKRGPGIGIAHTIALHGMQAIPVTVEVNIVKGLPRFSIIGVTGRTANEAVDRVRAALSIVDPSIGMSKVLVNLTPANTVKTGSQFDLAIAAAVLRALGHMKPGNECWLGELTIHGDIVGIPGIFPSVQDCDSIVVPSANGHEANLACSGAIRLVSHINQLMDNTSSPPSTRSTTTVEPQPVLDMADVAGQEEARRAMEIAAAGHHNVLLIGPPGSGKSMLAKRLPSIMPPLDLMQSRQVAAIASINGSGSTFESLPTVPPFCAPHHCSTQSALIGGVNSTAQPGALTQAHQGVLFLDELFEWKPSLLDTLRQPLEERVIRHTKQHIPIVWPADVLLVAAGNACSCGPPVTGCRCAASAVQRYRAKLSGPLADRFDLAPHVSRITSQQFVDHGQAEDSSTVRERVASARATMIARQGKPNARANIVPIMDTIPSDVLAIFVQSAEVNSLSARGFDRAIRVARTIADLMESETISAHHAYEAIGHRSNIDMLWENR